MIYHLRYSEMVSAWQKSLEWLKVIRFANMQVRNDGEI